MDTRHCNQRSAVCVCVCVCASVSVCVCVSVGVLTIYSSYNRYDQTYYYVSLKHNTPQLSHQRYIEMTVCQEYTYD